MLYVKLLLILAALTSGYAVPSGHIYQAPGPNDVRSPCPGLNSLANHGFIPHDGKNISPSIVANGMLQGLNIALDCGLLIGTLATAANPNILAGTFDLDQLLEHNFPLEHDASLSRQDYYQGDNLHFNQSVFDEVLSFYAGTDFASIPAAAQAIWSRVHTQQKINPNQEIYGPLQLVRSLLETSLYLSTMGDPVTGAAPILFVKSLFEQERFPYELGWSAPTTQITVTTIAAMAAKLIAADPGDLILDASDLTVGAIRDVLQGRDPISGKLVNATCSVIDLC